MDTVAFSRGKSIVWDGSPDQCLQHNRCNPMLLDIDV